MPGHKPEAGEKGGGGNKKNAQLAKDLLKLTRAQSGPDAGRVEDSDVAEDMARIEQTAREGREAAAASGDKARIKRAAEEMDAVGRNQDLIEAEELKTWRERIDRDFDPAKITNQSDLDAAIAKYDDEIDPATGDIVEPYQIHVTTSVPDGRKVVLSNGPACDVIVGRAQQAAERLSLTDDTLSGKYVFVLSADVPKYLEDKQREQENYLDIDLARKAAYRERDAREKSGFDSIDRYDKDTWKEPDTVDPVSGLVTKRGRTFRGLTDSLSPNRNATMNEREKSERTYLDIEGTDVKTLTAGVESDFFDPDEVKARMLETAREAIQNLSEQANQVGGEATEEFLETRRLTTDAISKTLSALADMYHEKEGAHYFQAIPGKAEATMAVLEAVDKALKRNPEPFHIDNIDLGGGKVAQQLMFHTDKPNLIIVERWDRSNGNMISTQILKGDNPTRVAYFDTDPQTRAEKVAFAIRRKLFPIQQQERLTPDMRKLLKADDRAAVAASGAAAESSVDGWNTTVSNYTKLGMPPAVARNLALKSKSVDTAYGSRGFWRIFFGGLYQR